MHPILLELGGVLVYSYGILVLAGALAGLGWIQSGSRLEWPLSGWQSLELAVATLTVAALASRLPLLALGDGLHLSLARSGGFVQLGALGGVVVIVTYARRLGVSPWILLDRAAGGLALAETVGRFGCLAAGCCFGIPVAGPGAVVYADPVAHALAGVPLGVPLHPTPVYFAGAGLVTFVVVRLASDRGRAGQAVATFAIVAGLLRLVLEPFRGDPRGRFGSYAWTQGIAIGFVLVGVSCLLAQAAARRRGRAATVNVSPGAPGRSH